MDFPKVKKYFFLNNTIAKLFEMDYFFMVTLFILYFFVSVFPYFRSNICV